MSSVFLACITGWMVVVLLMDIGSIKEGVGWGKRERDESWAREGDRERMLMKKRQKLWEYCHRAKSRIEEFKKRMVTVSEWLISWLYSFGINIQYIFLWKYFHWKSMYLLTIHWDSVTILVCFLCMSFYRFLTINSIVMVADLRNVVLFLIISYSSFLYL